MNNIFLSQQMSVPNFGKQTGPLLFSRSSTLKLPGSYTLWIFYLWISGPFIFFFNKTIAVPIPRMSKYGGSIHAPVTLDNNGWHQFEWINQSTRRNWHSAARHVVASPCRYFRWDKPKPPEPEVLLWRTTANTVVTDKSVLLQREDGKRSPNSKPPSIPCWCSEARYPFQLQIRLIRYHAPHGQELSLNASMLHLHDWSWIMPFSSQFLRHSEVCVPGLFRTINANS
jgi:hypothetical protein